MSHWGLLTHSLLFLQVTFPRQLQPQGHLFENTVNSWAVKNNCLDANGLFLMSFQFLYMGFMFKKRHHLFVLLTSERCYFFL